MFQSFIIKKSHVLKSSQESKHNVSLLTKTLIIGIFLIIAAVCFIAPASAGDETPAYAQDRILVKYSPYSVAAYSTDRDKYVESILSTYTLVPGLQVVQLRDNVTVEEAIDYFNKQPGVEYAEPDYYVSLSQVPNDPYYNDEPWNLWNLNNNGEFTDNYIWRDTSYTYTAVAGADAKLEGAWDYTTGSSDIVVAVLDTGVNYYHEDIKDNMWSKNGKYGYDFVNDDDDDDPMDDDGHGTHCAGTIGAVGNNNKGITGAAWNVSIMAVKVLNETGHGGTAQIISGIQYAVDNGADIISMSLGGYGYSTSEYEAIREAGESGVLCVAAAGNENSNIDNIIVSPAVFSSQLDNVISVGATAYDDTKVVFSNFGVNNVTVTAPGLDILSLDGSGNNGYRYISGTSQATPLVSGIAALMLSVDETLTPAQIKSIIRDTSDDVTALHGVSASNGRVNATAAVMAVLTLEPVSYFAGGDGSSEHPYQIATASDLKNLSVLVNAGNTAYDSSNYIVTGDINLEGYANWTPIGTYPLQAFKGTFDGGNYNISNLCINEPSADVLGLFGCTNNATIKDLGLINVSVKGNELVGGLVGINYVVSETASIENCYVTGNVEGFGLYVGGLAGASSGTIRDSYATGAVTGNRIVSGLVGENRGSIINCYATGAVTGTGDIVGGLVGGNNGGTIENCYAIGAVTGTGDNSDYIGGLVGWNDGTITKCYATGTVTGVADVGGLVGNNYPFYSGPASITKSVALNDYIIGNTNVSRVAGISEDGYINNCYAWDGMLVNGVKASSGDNNGTGASSAQIWNNESFYKLTELGWKFDVDWKMGSENEKYKLPILKWQPQNFNGDASYLKSSEYTIIHIVPGWNFISIPKKLSTTSNTANILFGTINTSNQSIFTFDGNTQSWKKILKDDILTPMTGYWIYSDDAEDITLEFDAQDIQNTKEVYKGWNTIGISGTKPISAHNFLLYSDWKKIIRWDTSTKNYIIISENDGTSTPSDEKLEPTVGYWVYQESNNTITQ